VEHTNEQMNKDSDVTYFHTPFTATWQPLRHVVDDVRHGLIVWNCVWSRNLVSGGGPS